MTMQITTLIPAYKPKYFIELLTALRHQTVKPARVIVSDDSPDQAFVAMLNAEPLKSLVADLHIEVVAGPRTGGYNNFRHLLRLYRDQPGGPTELFHLLLDDDIPYPSFYARHLQAHGQASLGCVVSRRWTALESGQPIRDLPVPAALDQHPQRMLVLGNEMLFAQTVGVSSNWLGEFSNVTFPAAMAQQLDDPSMAGICFSGLEDLGGFLKVGLIAPLGYINEHLGYFRTSAEQHSAKPMGRPMKLAHLAYIALTLAGRQIGLLSADQAAVNLASLCPTIVQRYGHEEDMAELCAVLPALGVAQPGAEQRFMALWHVYSGASTWQEMPSTVA